ncbi:reverse transcriptase domain-containing protein [Trichonephila inaurata madagascariensis]|uniref:Reverse transcriptase domain-containing protein n=1 Tax=Trichonephila inaurata madagascariensis TaxID=2747483 RepID=A0A8X7C9F7_9ARAC|nr:reverse transcriptase domain-containing protein [Trichonephila inaurata madagascariensis]
MALDLSTVEEQCRLSRRTLLKARKANLKINVLKTQLPQTSVNYLGYVLSNEGIKPDPKKIRAIEEFATPNCKDFLAVTVFADTSKNGAVLLQGQLVAYGSVLLTWTQQHYTQIEKELMAVIYGLEHFNYYTHGRIVPVQTDHANTGPIQPAKDMSLPAELLMGRKLRTFLPSHPGQLKPTFDVERAREALRKRHIIQNKYANKHATVRNRFHIRQDYTENDDPQWSRTVEDLYNSYATEISRIPNDSADSQRNASPKTNRGNINQRLQVPIETYSGQSNPLVLKSSRNIVKHVHYRDN